MGNFSFVSPHGTDIPECRQIGGHGVDVGEIHGQRIIRFFAQTKRCRRTCRRDNRVDFAERLLKVTCQQRAHRLRFK